MENNKCCKNCVSNYPDNTPCLIPTCLCHQEKTSEEKCGIEINNFVRDVSKVGSIPKSEIYRRLQQLIQKAKREGMEWVIEQIPHQHYKCVADTPGNKPLQERLRLSSPASKDN